MIFQAPQMLLLLAVLPILGKLLARARRKQDQAAAKLRGGQKVCNHWKKGAGFQLGAFAALVIALAQPAWNPHPGPLQMQGRDLLIALDISRSMLADDVFPTRLDAAKIALHEGLENLQGQKIGLITFAGAASVRVPLTLDHNFVKYMLDRAQPSDADVGSTSLQAAIEKALDIALNESKQGTQDIILFTDGEDHISDIDTTAEELRDCGARVLIVGIGDPVGGAKVPAIAKVKADEPGIGNDRKWMQYEGQDVVTRLDEAKLNQLSEQSPNVIYYSAQTRPFDLVALYRQLITDTSDLPVSDETQLVYTEGYPVFIALALILWLVPLNRRLFPALLLCILAGCTPESPLPNTAYTENIEQGRTLWAEAQEFIEADPRNALALLSDARTLFLRAAMSRPGDDAAARQIAAISAQLRTAEAAVKAQEKAEKDLQQKLEEAIAQLQRLVPRENALAQQSQQLLRRRPAAPPEEKRAAAEPSRTEQDDIGDGTGAVLETVTDVQAVIRKMLAAAFNDSPDEPPTEFDEAVDALTQARASQTDALNNLNPDAVQWPQANSAFHSASRQMQEALRILTDQNQGQSGEDSDELSDDGEMDWDFDGDMERSESDMPSDISMPMQSGQFQSALQNRSLPTPNYTAEEILMEEAANMEQRAQQQSGRAGAKVEKNW
ncbi:MAG: VWA domain-containing protein [Kiritimatiellales bacterium]|nr:VWA domain-containing protein [Kiritimatiellales bacterium]